MKLQVTRKDTMIFPDNNRVIARFFFNGEERAEKLLTHILAMPEDEVHEWMIQILREFSPRHRSITSIFKNHYKKVESLVKKVHGSGQVSEYRKLLIGSYFSMEYSIESAALFNPSIVEDPDQSGLEPGQKRVIISLRATGEGHISSLVFRRAIINADNSISLDDAAHQIDEAERVKNYVYDKDSFEDKLKEMDIAHDFYGLVTRQLPGKFIFDQIKEAVRNTKENNGGFGMEKIKALDEILWLADSHTEIRFSLDTDLNERVIFPISKFEKNGIEDARFVQFTKPGGDVVYYGTYTAFDGYTILPKLIETKDFYSFKIFPLQGKAAIDKNLALFPRKVNGKYVMISRIDGVNNYIMFSDKLVRWSNAQILSEPVFPWELVQVGNGGSPIETEKGWLLITHGVGPVRKYCLGACLLDLDDPARVIGRLKEPLLMPVERERSGYVPNVVYTCGSYVHNGELIIPYAMSDYATGFAGINLDELLEALQ
ncbi:MAG: glycoside hydrolase family 130 protein [Tangfeifania sp.]